MNQIESMNKISRESLSSESYFTSLLDEAVRQSLLTSNELERIQLGCLTLLRQKTEQYNHGDSSSIRVEAAQGLLNCILFTIGVALKVYPKPDNALNALQHDGVIMTYQNGRARIDLLLEEAKQIHASLANNLFPSKNEFYAATIVEGLNGFFKLYSPELSAQEIHITADYPVHQPINRLLGIEFIRRYLDVLQLENQFLTLFSAETVHHLLRGYAAEYETQVINLYEPVLSVALGCVLSGVDVLNLTLSPTELGFLWALFQSKKRVEIAEMLATATTQLCHMLSLPNSLAQYLRGSLPPLAISIELALSLQTLERVFPLPSIPNETAKLSISLGSKMDHTTYRKLLAELGECRFLSDQIALVKEELHSLADFEDLLLDAAFSEEELHAMLSQLAPAELCALLKRHPAPESFDMDDLNEHELTLRQSLQHFLNQLPQEEAVWIRQAVALIEITE